MKTKTLVLIGVLIIALAAMAMPVMADLPGDATGGATGNQAANATLSLNNGSASFGTFNLGTNLISASNGKSFPEVVVSSNEEGWSVSVWANPNPMAHGSHALTNSLKMKNEMGTITGITNDLGTSFTTISTNSGAQTKLMHGTPILANNVTLGLQQDILQTDTADSSYATVLTFTYASHV